VCAIHSLLKTFESLKEIFYHTFVGLDIFPFILEESSHVSFENNKSLNCSYNCGQSCSKCESEREKVRERELWFTRVEVFEWDKLLLD
jgi:hypothetical protein